MRSSMAEKYLGRADRIFLSVALPAGLEGFFLVALSAADIIMVGTLGIEAIAAVSIFTQPRMVLLVFARSIGSALTVLVAHRHGAGRDGAALLRQTLLLSLVLFLLLHGLFFWQLPRILSWMGAESYLDLALSYGYLALGGVFLTSLATVLQAYLLGIGRVRSVMGANVWGSAANVLGNALFIFGPGPFPALGVVGAAAGTLIGTGLTLLLTLWSMRGGSLFSGSWRVGRSYLREVMPQLTSVFAEQGFERVGMVLYTRMVAELGMTAYAIHAICMNVCDFYYSFAGGLGKAAMVAGGHAFGARDGALWREILRAGLRWTFLFSCVAFLVTVLLREQLVLLYAEDASVVPLGACILIFVAAANLPAGHQLAAAGFLRAAGMAFAVASYSFLSIAVLRPCITALFLFVFDLGLAGAWLALLLDQCLRAGAASFLLFVRAPIARETS